MSSKLDFRQFVMTSQVEWKQMVEGTKSVEDCLSCDDSLYDEHNLEVSNSGNGVHGGSEDEEYGGDSINVQRMGP